MSAANPTEEEVRDYVINTYGSCKLGQPKCQCHGMLGTSCPHWAPVEGDDLIQIMTSFFPKG